MTRLINISHDFETYSEADLSKVGAWAYSQHPSTEVICWAMAVEDTSPILWLPGNEYPYAVQNYSHYMWHAFNSWFEYCIWVNVLKLPPLPIQNQSCTRSRALAMALPRSLGEVSRVIGLPVDKRKDKNGKALIRKLCMPQTKGRGQNKTYYRNRDPQLLQELYAYCLQDVVAEREVGKLVPPLSPKERGLWERDFQINLRGVPVDTDLLDNATAIYEQIKVSLHDKLVIKTGLGNPSSGPQFLKYLAGQGCPVPNLQKATLDEVKQTLPAPLKQIVEERSSLIRTPATKYASVASMLGTSGRFHGALTYHMANTGRWSSTGVNFQNLNRPKLKPYEVGAAVDLMKARDANVLKPFFGDPMETITSCLRAMLYAPEGNKLIVADYKSIEARMLAWLAGHEEKLAVLRGHGKVYEHAAMQIFNLANIDDVNKDQRQAGKVTELACGYGGATNAILNMAKTLKIDLQAIALSMGYDSAESFAKDIVKKWRKANPSIVNFWRQMENAAKDTLRTGRPHAVNQYLYYELWRDFLFMVLPSGRRLSFKDPHFTEGLYGPQISYWRVNSVTGKWVIHHTHGGDQAQSASQAGSRDVLSWAVPDLEDAGYSLVMLTHDEAVADVPEGFGSLKEMSAIMCKDRPWYVGLPLDADGFEARRYEKG